MTTLMPIDVRCAACGKTTSILEVGSTNTFGSADLDTRPPEMKRSTIEYWVQCCPACGYCAASLETAAAGIDELMGGKAYRETLNRADYPAKCNEFLCQAMVCKAGGDLAAAIWATIHAAWICDDADNSAAAAVCRLAVAALGREAEANGAEWIEPAEASVAIRGDMLRRAGAFQEALTIIDVALAASHEPFLRDLLHFEKNLIEAGDRAAHTVAEIAQHKATGREDKQEKPTAIAPRLAFTRYQRQQFARLQRADRWIHRRAKRSIDRGDPLHRINRCLRRGLIEALRAALFEVGDKTAGGYRWAALIERASALLPATAVERDALITVAAMPFRPDEPAWWLGGEALDAYLAANRRHQAATWDVQQLTGRIAGESLGIRDGRWLRLAAGQTCKLLRWNGIVALLGDVGALDVIDYFDVLDAIGKDTMTWIDDAAEIERLEARLVTPVPAREADEEAEDSAVTERKDDLPLDPARATMVLLQESEIAGLPFHRAKAVAARLVRGMRLQLAREPDNAYDTEAVAILMDSGEKLGYVPRRCNAGIAQRLDASVALGIWLTHVAWDRDAPQGPTPWRIGIEIRSADPNDVPDEKLDDRPTPDNEATVTTPAATPAMRRAARSYWPFKFAFGAIEKARAALGRNALGEMLNHVDTAYKWAQEAPAC